jgi:signal transduction histidine kinase
VRLPLRLDSWQSRDSVLAAAFAAIALIPAFGQYGLVLGELPERPSDSWRVVLVLAQTLPLAGRRTAPVLCLGVVGAAFALDQCLAYPPSPAGLGVLFALYSVGAHQRRGRIAAASVSAAAYVCLSVVLTNLGSPERPWDLATFGFVLAAAWGVGDFVRTRGAAAQSRAELQARAAVFDERARLARELHDVVSHHVTGMVVQADAAAFLLPVGEQAVRGQLAGIAGAGRGALDDLRRLLDVLGTEAQSGAPQPGSLTDLTAGARRTGQSVELHEHGAPHGPAEPRLAVYRVVQEGLTNARKHASGAAVRVTVRWGTATTRVQVITVPAPGTTETGPAAPGSGRGLAGLRDRVERLGGDLHAAPAAGGGFVLEATIPFDPSEPDEDEDDA